MNKKSKGIVYFHTKQEIREYMKMPVESKLEWLQSANEFTYQMLRGKRLKIWEKFRRGEL